LKDIVLENQLSEGSKGDRQKVGGSRGKKKQNRVEREMEHKLRGTLSGDQELRSSSIVNKEEFVGVTGFFIFFRGRKGKKGN